MITLQTKRDFIRKLVNENKGKYFTVAFYKKGPYTKGDLEERVMYCQRGIQENLKGGTNNQENKSDLLCVWDRKAKGYRTVWLDTVGAIQLGGKRYNVENTKSLDVWPEFTPALEHIA